MAFWARKEEYGPVTEKGLAIIQRFAKSTWFQSAFMFHGAKTDPFKGRRKGAVAKTDQATAPSFFIFITLSIFMVESILHSTN